MAECCCECNAFELSSTELEKLDHLDSLLEEFIAKPGGLIPALQAVQGEFGYLPESALKKIAAAFDKPYSEVTGVVTFYSFFSTVPRGEFLVRVCLGTACYVRGGNEVLDALKKELGVDVGGTTADRRFSLDIGRCFGACGLAPVVMVNDDVHQRIRPNQVQDMLAAYQNDTEGADE